VTHIKQQKLIISHHGPRQQDSINILLETLRNFSDNFVTLFSNTWF